MIPLIREIIQQFGPRTAGSEQEKGAQEFMLEKSKTITDNASIIPFEDYLDARFGKLKYYCGLYAIAVICYFIYPPAALVLGLLNAVAFVLDFMMYYTVLGSFPGSKKKSWNVEAVLDPQGEVKSTLILSGHIDSVYEFKWWYKLGQLGAHLNLVGGVLMVTFPLLVLFSLFFPTGNWHFYGVLAYVLLSPALITFFDMHGDNPVDGACDNLSGIAVAFSVFKNFADDNARGKSILKHTRLKFVSFGSEETGLTGSYNYVKQKQDELRKENAHIVNIDSIRLPEEVSIITGETMNGTRYSSLLIERIQQGFTAKGIPIKAGATPIGGTDGVFFVRAGFHAVSLIGLSMKNLDPTYHTRRDTVEQLNPQALENTRLGLIEMVKNWDSNS